MSHAKSDSRNCNRLLADVPCYFQISATVFCKIPTMSMTAPRTTLHERICSSCCVFRDFVDLLQPIHICNPSCGPSSTLPNMLTRAHIVGHICLAAWYTAHFLPILLLFELFSSTNLLKLPAKTAASWRLNNVEEELSLKNTLEPLRL